MNAEKIEKKLNYTFKDKNLLRRALTLASADNENNNQVLEFFGDAILEFLVSERIFSESETEGSLTEKRKSIVSDSALTPVSKKLGLDKFLIKNPHDNRNLKAVPSAYEAVVAAVYLDGGIDAARAFVYSTLNFEADGGENYKGELQEILQRRGEDCPVYKRMETGTQKKPQFCSQVTVFGKKFSGTAGSVKQSEQKAAKAALEYLNNNGKN